MMTAPGPRFTKSRPAKFLLMPKRNSQQTMSTLTPQQLAAWHEDGYLVLPQFKPADALAKVIARAHAIVDAFEPASGASKFSTRDRSQVNDAALLASAHGVHCFFEEEALDEKGRLRVPKAQSINKIGHALHDRDPVFQHFSHSAKLAALGCALGLTQPQVWQSQLIFKQPRIGGEVGWHQDASFFATTPHSVLTFWFALEDATLDNGCLWVQRGGHRGEYRGAQAVLREQYVCENQQLHMRQLSDAPWPTMNRALALPVAAGSLVVFDGLLPHCSLANRSDKSRLAYTLHATDASATYSPLNWLQRGPAFPVGGLI
jgi:phytanoyl-CoA hydroxylase